MNIDVTAILNHLTSRIPEEQSFLWGVCLIGAGLIALNLDYRKQIALLKSA